MASPRASAARLIAAAQGESPGAQPSLVYRSGWGARLLSAIFFSTLSAAAIYAFDEESGFEPLAYAVTLGCFLTYALLFAQQARARFVLFADRLERFGLRGKQWEVALADVEGIRHDPTQRSFPFGKAIVLYDRQRRMLVVPRSIYDVKGLATHLTEQHARAALPGILARLESGHEIQFGEAISVDRERLVAPDLRTRHPTQWHLRDFQKVYMRGGELRMSLIGKGAALCLKSRDVLNAHLLVPVITRAKALGPRVDEPPAR